MESQVKDQELYNELKSCFVRTVDGRTVEDFMPIGAIKIIKEVPGTPFYLLEQAVLGRACINSEERRAVIFKFCSELRKEE